MPITLFAIAGKGAQSKKGFLNGLRWRAGRIAYWRTTTQLVVLLVATLAASIMLLTALHVRTQIQAAYDTRTALAIREGAHVEQLLGEVEGNIHSSQVVTRIQDVLEDVSSTGGFRSFFMVDRDGLILAHSNISVIGGRYRNPDMVAALDDGKVVTAKEQENGFVRFDVVVPLRYKGLVVGAIEAQYSLESLDREIEDAKKDGLISALIVALILIPATTIVIARMHRSLEQLAITDGLSELFDHRYFRQRLDEEVKRAARYGHRLALILFDIDSFKSYNDTYGHLKGDEAIKDIARLTRESIRGVDVAARYGGEEFTVILPETSLEQARLVAERIRLAVNIYFATGTRPGPLTASFGVAAYPSDAGSAEDLIHCADVALYQAKSMGKNSTSLYCLVAKQTPLEATPDSRK